MSENHCTSKPRHLLYRIWYGDIIVYLGRTKQPLQNRLRGHFFKNPIQRAIDIFKVSKIEYSVYGSVADMYLYEIYYINKYKPDLNRDDKAKDELSVFLPDMEWFEFKPPLMEKWREEISENDRIYAENRKQEAERAEMKRQKRHKLREMWHNGEISEDEYFDLLDELQGS